MPQSYGQKVRKISEKFNRAVVRWIVIPSVEEKEGEEGDIADQHLKGQKNKMFD